VLHHIPSDEIRLEILRTVHDLLAEGGKFIHANWQFLNSEKLKARIKPWEDAAVSESDVDAGDYLLDWRSGGQGLRYVHHFTEADVEGETRAELAAAGECPPQSGRGAVVTMNEQAQRVLILGGGFGGLTAARCFHESTATFYFALLDLAERAGLALSGCPRRSRGSASAGCSPCPDGASCTRSRT
jgi:hypothetical protein